MIRESSEILRLLWFLRTPNIYSQIQSRRINAVGYTWTPQGTHCALCKTLQDKWWRSHIHIYAWCKDLLFTLKKWFPYFKKFCIILPRSPHLYMIEAWGFHWDKGLTFVLTRNSGFFRYLVPFLCGGAVKWGHFFCSNQVAFYFWMSWKLPIT